jgi:hypothetical protein
MKRRALSKGDKIAILLRQATCPRCGEVLGDAVDWDHAVPLSHGGDDHPSNIRAMHRECHRIKTIGTHVPMSGDISIAAKLKRLAAKTAAHREVVLKILKPEEREQLERLPPKRTIPSRPFPPRGQLPLNWGPDSPALTPRERKRLHGPTRKSGHAWRPGTGPAGETCGSCAHKVTKHTGGWNKSFVKCGLMEKQWTHGAGTDIRAHDPACKFWERKP